jgi:hypothetical protein
MGGGEHCRAIGIGEVVKNNMLHSPREQEDAKRNRYPIQNVGC